MMKAQFKQMVESGDIEGIRISLANEMMLDPRGESFKEMQAYAESLFSDLYDPHDGKELDENQANWTEELLFSTKNDLDNNYSKERLEYYYVLAQVVLRDKAERLLKKDRRCQSQPSKMSDKTNNDNHAYSTPILMGLAVGGLLLGGTGLIIGRSIIAAIGLTSAVVSGGILYKNYHK